ncbi:L-asparaginase [Macrosteles quadrilineatus]|uniref:L-asparaginase n=1 Tax=Macrosteles quadrilineatus TaxID=74068 RepID=UPI0023E2B40C|nr:L-asparaginase [Macrosteles quadrilineatus]
MNGLSQSPVHNHVSGLRKESLAARRGSAALSVTESNDDVTDYRRVMVIYTGGTIGMVRGDDGALVPIPNEFEKKLRQNPQMHDAKYAKAMFGSSSDMAPLVLPNVQGMHRIVYSITEYEPLLDSSNMTMADWSTIAYDIHQAYEFYDGFVILHGTDTMSYTASALSFMLENLGKTVVITGAQISIFEVRSDGIDNFLSSLLIAGNFVIPEVTLFFNYKLLRGNRTTKVSSESFHAFDSPNTPPLVIAGIHFEVDYRSIFRPCTLEKFVVHCELNQNVGLLRVFPSIQTKTVETFLKPPIEGVVLQTYGSGNMPSNRVDLLEVIAEAAKRGVLIINITQCATGSVCPAYETGKMLYSSGVIPGYDMTPEAALTKLAYVLSKSDWDLNTKRNMLESNLRGELTSGKINQTPVLEDWDLIDAVARSMHISSPTEVKMLHAILFPAMLTSAVEKGDTGKIAELKNYGADISATNPDKRTPLHIACTIGDVKVVKFLLLNGASVHMKDRFDQTPLLDAVKHDHVEVIKLLRRCGAHLTLTPNQIGCQLCSAASYGNLKRLQSYHAAGANLGQPDISGRTALHMAALHSYADIAKFLLSNGVDPQAKDLLGLTALEMATKTENQEIKDILKSSV